MKWMAKMRRWPAIIRPYLWQEIHPGCYIPKYHGIAHRYIARDTRLTMLVPAHYVYRIWITCWYAFKIPRMWGFETRMGRLHYKLSLATQYVEKRRATIAMYGRSYDCDEEDALLEELKK